MNKVVIAGAARTPMGGFQGAMAQMTAADLGGHAIKAALKGAGVPTVDEVVMGCVLPAGQGQAPARQAGFKAGLGEEVPATTINKMCGSGMKAAMIAFDQIALGQSDVVVAGGMESMTNAPYMLPKMRSGARLGHNQVIDHMFLDGLEDAYDKGRLMGTFAEDCAETYQFTRAFRTITRWRRYLVQFKPRKAGRLTMKLRIWMRPHPKAMYISPPTNNLARHVPIKFPF